MRELDFRLDGRVALITGAGRGIGLGIAQALAAAGCAVGIQDIDGDVAASAAQAIVGEGGHAIGLDGDITDLSLPQRAVGRIMREFGGLHILINNAAIQLSKNWMDLSVEEIAAQVNADFISPILFCQEAVRIFKPQGFGRIINIGSIQQRSGNPDMLPYSMCKSALENLTRGLARGLAPHGTTVNLLAPGYFNTWRNRDDFKTPNDLIEKGRAVVPMGRIGEPQDCAGISLMLCGDAGAYITGQTIYVDGGMSVR